MYGRHSSSMRLIGVRRIHSLGCKLLTGDFKIYVNKENKREQFATTFRHRPMSLSSKVTFILTEHIYGSMDNGKV